MLTYILRRPLILKLATVTAAVLLASMAQGQPPPASMAHVTGKMLMRRDVIGLPGKEAVLSTVEIPPGVSSAPHRHDAQVFVYMYTERGAEERRL